MEDKDLTDNHLYILQEILKKNSSLNGECLEWQGKLTQGYGRFMAFKICWAAHRAAFLVKNKTIPQGLYICHKCNNRKCINIDHLYAGTPKQNAQDLKNSNYYHLVKEKGIQNKKKNRLLREKKLKDSLDHYLTVKEVSEILNVHPNTVLNCLHSGHIQGLRTGIGARSSYRVPLSEFSRMGLFNLEEVIEKIIEKRSQNIPKSL